MEREKVEEVRASFDRFWIPEPNSGCWLWTGAITGRGYGSFHWEGRSKVAHRLSYVLAGKTIPAGLVLDHKCRVRGCVNPDHLRPMTNEENLLIGFGLPARNKRKTHCEAGHLLPEKRNRAGYRICLICRRASKSRYTMRRKFLQEQ